MSESIADILREMRILGRIDEKSTDKIPRSLQALGLRAYAHRIEAAYRREVEDAIAATVKASAKSASEVYEPHIQPAQVGNTAKMRDALEHVEKLAREFAVGNYYVSDFPKMLLDAIRPALAAPPRNCDIYRTKKERDAAYKKYREYVIMSNANPFIAQDEMMPKENWLFAEAKGEDK